MKWATWPTVLDAANVLFHVVNERHLKRRPMIFTTNKPLDAWGHVLHDKDLAAAIVDRILERGRLLKLDGPSIRAKHLGLDDPTDEAPTQPAGASEFTGKSFRNPQERGPGVGQMVTKAGIAHSPEEISMKQTAMAVVAVLAGCAGAPTAPVGTAPEPHDGVTSRSVRFQSDGRMLAGRLYMPAPEAFRRHPALVLAGPLGATKEMVNALYAERMARVGYAALAFDFRNLGESEGEPRQYIDPHEQLQDLKNALSFLARQPEVDAERLGALGICQGGGTVLALAAFDRRVKAVAGVAGGYGVPEMADPMVGGRANLVQALLGSNLSRSRSAGTGSVETMPLVAPNDEPSLMRGAEPYEYYSKVEKKVPAWKNAITVSSVENLLESWALETALAAPLISPTPLLLVHGTTDRYTPPEGARKAFDLAGEPKEIRWIETHNHIELYDQEPYVTQASSILERWFHDHLPLEGVMEKR